MKDTSLIKQLERIDKMSRPSVITAAILLVLLIGFFDYVTGYELSASLFYMLPVMLLTWSAGITAATSLSVLSAATWLFADVMSGHSYSHLAIPLWNTVMRFGFFMLGAYFLSALRKALDREKESARRDSLTGIFNSRYFHEMAEREIQRALRFNRPLTVAYMDIDNFKQVNDSLGHSSGDILLHAVATTIRENIRSIDFVARCGGDEFVFLLPETDSEKGKIVINKVTHALSDIVQKNGWPVSFSIGVITFYAPRYTAGEMIHMADALMYSAKNSGKNMIKYETAGEHSAG